MKKHLPVRSKIATLHMKQTTLFFLLLTLCSLSLATAHGYPSDSELIKRFIEKRQEFNKLVSMDQADKGAFGFYLVTDVRRKNLTQQKIEAYQNLIHQLGLKGYGGMGQSAFGIRLTVSSFDFLNFDSAKGYAWLSITPKVLASSLDGNLNIYKPQDGRLFSVYRRIEGNWYLYYSQSSDESF